MKQILDLPPNRDEFKLDGFPYNRQPDPVGVRCRSLLGIMFFLSKAVEVPPEHPAAGIAATTHDDEDTSFDWGLLTGKLLVIHAQQSRPPNAWLAV